MKKQLSAFALTLAACSSWGAVCTYGNWNFGSLAEYTGGPDYSYGALCSALGQDPANPATWSFTHQVSFTMAQAGDIYGVIDLNFTRSGPANPQAPGEPFFVVRIDPIVLVHDGVSTRIGGEGAGHNEVSRFYADDLEAGDYTLLLRGTLFDTGARTGFYDGFLRASYDVAAPVPEPAAIALLAMGAPLAMWGARRRPRATAA